jgi:hypothetical protein
VPVSGGYDKDPPAKVLTSRRRLDAGVGSATVIFAHPVSGHAHVDIPLVLTAGASALLVFFVALAVPTRAAAVPAPSQAPSPAPDAQLSFETASWSGVLSRPQLVVRAGAVALLALVIATGRVGVDQELENLAPALVVGTAWPLLMLSSVALGPLWRWVDPWDSVARAVNGQGRDQASAQVWPAVPVALAVVWYLSAYPAPLDPRSVGAALALYTILTLAGCVAFGRVRWLSCAEPVGLVLSWAALLPRRRLTGWVPPRGAEALLGVLAGGVLFGAVRQSEIWGDLQLRPDALLLSTIGVTVLSLVVAGTFLAAARLAKPVGGQAGVARAVVPALAGIVVAVALERDRIFTSVQLLPGLFGDPFGRGWDLLGSPVDGLVLAPLGATGLLILQLVVLLLAHMIGAAVTARQLQDTARLPAAVVLLHLMAGSVLAVAAH